MHGAIWGSQGTCEAHIYFSSLEKRPSTHVLKAPEESELKKKDELQEECLYHPSIPGMQGQSLLLHSSVGHVVRGSAGLGQEWEELGSRFGPDCCTVSRVLTDQLG